MKLNGVACRIVYCPKSDNWYSCYFQLYSCSFSVFVLYLIDFSKKTTISTAAATATATVATTTTATTTTTTTTTILLLPLQTSTTATN